jgi:hypothetical protein
MPHAELENSQSSLDELSKLLWFQHFNRFDNILKKVDPARIRYNTLEDCRILYRKRILAESREAFKRMTWRYEEIFSESDSKKGKKMLTTCKIHF